MFCVVIGGSFYKLAYKSSQGEDAYLDDTKVATDVRMVFKDLI